MSFFSFTLYNKSITYVLMLSLVLAVLFSLLSFSVPTTQAQQNPPITDDSNVEDRYGDHWGDWDEPESPGIFDTLKDRFGRLLSYLRGDDLDETAQGDTSQYGTVATIEDQYKDDYNPEDRWGDWEDPEYPTLLDIAIDRFSRWISYMRGDDIDEAMKAEKNNNQQKDDSGEVPQTPEDINQALLPEDEEDFNWGTTPEERNEVTDTDSVSDDKMPDTTQNEADTSENTPPSKPNTDTVIDGYVIDNDDSDVTDDIATSAGCPLPSKQEWNNALPPGFTYTILGGKYAKVTNSRPYCGINSKDEFTDMAEKTIKLLQCPTASVTNISYTDVSSPCTFFVQFGK